MKQPKTYWKTGRSLDISTAPFTAIALIRRSHTIEDTEQLVNQLTRNSVVSKFIENVGPDGENILNELYQIVANYLTVGVPRAGYIKLNIETREVWLDV